MTVSLGDMYEKGRGIAQDNQKALKLYHQVAERERRGNELAAKKHYSGVGDSVDRVLQMMN